MAHLLDGDEYGNKLMVEVEDGYVLMYSVERVGTQVRTRHMARFPVNRLLALAEVIKSEAESHSP